MSTFNQTLKKIDWESLYTCGDVNVCAHLFRMQLIEVCDKHAPYRLLKLQEHAPPWLNTSYLDAADNREHWSRKCNKNPNEIHLQKKFESIDFAKNLQKSYFEEQIQNSMGDSKQLWKSINEFWPEAKRVHLLLK